MPDLLTGAFWDTMTLPDYYADFERNFWTIDSTEFWMLEFQQHFQEPGYDSWETFPPVIGRSRCCCWKSAEPTWQPITVG